MADLQIPKFHSHKALKQSGNHRTPRCPMSDRRGVEPIGAGIQTVLEDFTNMYPSREQYHLYRYQGTIWQRFYPYPTH